MYNLYLVKNREKLLLLSSKSQGEIDRFMTNFDNEEDFLDRFEVDESNKLVYEKISKKGNEKVPFLSFKYKDLFNSIDNYYYFLQVSNFDRDKVDYFFENEYFKYQNVDNPFLIRKSRVLKTIMDKMHDKSYTNYKFSKLMEVYFEGMYSSFKIFYMYLIDCGFEPKMKPFEDDKYDETFDRVEAKIKEGKYERIPTPDIVYDDTLDEINYIVSKDMDIDEKMSEIDILTDRYSDEKKLRLLNKKWL